MLSRGTTWFRYHNAERHALARPNCVKRRIEDHHGAVVEASVVEASVVHASVAQREQDGKGLNEKNTFSVLFFRVCVLEITVFTVNYNCESSGMLSGSQGQVCVDAVRVSRSSVPYRHDEL